MSRQGSLKILCLDGGDARCMSQLYIIGEYMHRLEHKLGKKVLPCEHFDLMAAVDSSSPIAVLLGLFRMSIEDAEQAFHDMYTAVFKNGQESPDTRAMHLKNEVKKLLDARSMPYTTRLSDFSSPDFSKVALCYSPTARLDSYKFFRNYQSPQQVTQDVTIIEALQATWAGPGSLSPIAIGPKGREETVMTAGNIFGNPIREVIKEAYYVFGGNTQTSCLLSVGSGFRGVVALGDGRNTSQGTHMDCERVAQEVNRDLARLNVCFRLSVDHGLEGWGDFGTTFGAIKSHVDGYLGRDEVSNYLGRCVAASVVEGTISLERIYGSRKMGNRSRHVLPPLSAFFVMRKKPMDALVKGLIERDGTSQRIMVISGVGGSGKTQLALKFARDFQESYHHVLFVDANSTDSIQKGLISRVRLMRTRRQPTTIEDALDILSNPDEEEDKNWFIIFNNVGNLDSPLSSYIPSCEHGSILITTRNPAMGHLAPNSHLELGSMEEDEAVSVLLASAFPAGKPPSYLGLSERMAVALLPTNRDREVAASIVKELECLPIAVVQAGCYIQQHKALYQYLDRLRTNRLDLLQRTTQVHRDSLTYPHGVYASFDIALKALPIRAVRLLGVLSFFHFSNFPRPLLAIAARSRFEYEFIQLLDRPPEFYSTNQLLIDILCPSGTWREADMEELLEDLQKYSLITLLPIHSMVTIRFNPLAHSWAQDLLSAEEKVAYRAAAVRLLVCGITPDDDDGIFEYLEPHVTPFSSAISNLHINDQAAVSCFLVSKQHGDAYMKKWTQIHETVESLYGSQHVRTSRALLGLANAHQCYGNREKGEMIVRDVIETRERLLGRDHPETATAYAILARTLRAKKDYLEAEALEKEVLRVYIHTNGLRRRDTAQGMMDLAATYHCMGHYKDEEGLLSGVIEIRTEVSGHATRSTISAIDRLAQCYHDQGRNVESLDLKKKVLSLQKKLHGERHPSTISSMQWLALQYQNQGQYQEAEGLMKIEVEIRKQVHGDQHWSTLEAISSLDEFYQKLEQCTETRDLWKEFGGHSTAKSEATTSSEAEVVVEQDSDDSCSSKDAALPDPGGDPAYSLPIAKATQALFSIRPQSPFTLRDSFGRRPNSWSMF